MTISKPQPLSEVKSGEILRGYSIPVVPSIFAATPAEAAAAAVKTGFPVVLKGCGDKVSHKSELGLVRVGLKSGEEVEGAAAAMLQRAGGLIEGFLVQPLVGGARELFAGFFRDPLFGPVIVFGVGGVTAEALADTVFALAPLEAADIKDMIGQIRAQKLLGPFRGEAAVDPEGLAELLNGLSRLACERPDIVEVDINPVKIALDGKLVAVDALVVTGEAVEAEASRPPVPGRDLFRLFHPSSVALIGASGTLGRWGQQLASNILAGGFRGEVYFVNRHGGEIYGRPVYRSLDEVPANFDLAVICVPAAAVREIIEELPQKGARYAVVISAGFRETGPAGAALEEELVAAARRAGVTFIGPNTMGILNPHNSFFATGVHVRPPAGGTAMLSQSGNMGVQLLRYAQMEGVGIRAFCGSGNEAFVSVEDFMEGFEADETTRCVQLYVESLKDGRRFFDSAKRLCRKKPVILLKGGRTEAGGRAAESHSGAMASDIKLFDAVLRQAGVISVKRPLEMLDTAAVFSSLPLPRGRRVAIMTFGGGWGVVASDLAAESGLDVTALSPEIIEKLDKILPPYWSRRNPIDLVGEPSPAIPMMAINELMRWEGCDAVVHLGILGQKHLVEWLLDSTTLVARGQDAEIMQKAKDAVAAFEESFLRETALLMDKFKKPVIGVNMAGQECETNPSSQSAGEYRPVVFNTPERAVFALSRMCQYADYLKR